MQPEHAPSNAILSYLSGADRDLLRPNLEPIDLPVRFRLAEASRPIDAVYFLEAGIASITTSVRHEVPAMRRSGDTLLGGAARVFHGGGSTVFHHGETGRRLGIFRDDDLALYDTKSAALPADCALWLELGRLPAG